MPRRASYSWSRLYTCISPCSVAGGFVHGQRGTRVSVDANIPGTWNLKNPHHETIGILILAVHRYKIALVVRHIHEREIEVLRMVPPLVYIHC
ncbi:hypothetical protein BD309DRAFT_955597 [Dichomitus squalens]|nr:hypothetical protein BD309DRAFT_955597 [Dichomitus squalens]